MRLGSGVEVLEPLEIREQIIATARRILERYEATGPAGTPEPVAVGAGRS
jgi:hypothetical protein